MIALGIDGVEVSLPVAAALAAFASKDATRPHLGVGVSGRNLVATDGHRLVSFPLSETVSIHHGKVWSREYVETMIKVARAIKAKSIVLAFAACLQGHKLPPTEQVMPDYGMTATESIGFMPEYVADLGKVCKACGADGAILSHARGALDPLGYTVRGREMTALAVVMPMRH